MICKISQYLLHNYKEQGPISGICRLPGGHEVEVPRVSESGVREK